MTVLRGARVLLRGWRDVDLDAFAALNADPRVMEHFPKLPSRDETAAMMARMQAAIDARGWGNWALEVDGACIGFAGLSVPGFQAHFTPCIEIGWRLTFDAWGHGYATEAAQLALAYGFDVVELPEIVSFTAATNGRSQRVMQRLAMRRRIEDDFDHPAMPGHRLQRHVLYRLSRDEYLGSRPPR
jgi:RimJ/RimL family protein N-acetyltransferase